MLLPRFRGMQSAQRAKTNYNLLHAVRVCVYDVKYGLLPDSTVQLGMDTRLLQTVVYYHKL